jgi:N-acetylglucosaminyldiphosphoundecaprenol N-acetyl-beta-D-mannosaminyltransferase
MINTNQSKCPVTVIKECRKKKGRMLMYDMVNPAEVPYFKFMGVRIDNLSYEDIYERIKNNVRRRGYVCLTDVGNVVDAPADNAFFEAINKSLISIADGMPLAWYGRLLGCKKIERISGVELMRRLLEDKIGFKHYLLGDTEQTIAKVIEKAKQNSNKIQLTGHSPPFRDKFNEVDNRTIFNKINKVDPDIVWVSFGGGKQDKWIHGNIHRLNRGVMIGVGAAFKFYIGELKIPPKQLQNIGLQWVSRLTGNPGRWLRRPLILRLRFIIHFPSELAKARREIKKEKRVIAD